MKFLFVPGSKLIELREAKGLIQEDIAASVGVSRQTVVTWEGKDLNKMKFENAQKVAKRLGVSINDLTNDKTIDSFRDIIENKDYVGMHRRVYDALEKSLEVFQNLAINEQKHANDLTQVLIKNGLR